MGFAVVECGIEMVFHGTRLLEAFLGGKFNVDFPASLVVYTSGVTMIEFYQRLIPLSFLMFIISYLALRNRGQTTTYWVLAVIVSLLEPLSQMGVVSAYLQSLGAKAPAGWQVAVIPVGIVTYLFNLVQAINFRRYGLLASFMMRLGEYLIWHILFWNLVAPFLLHI